MIIMKKLGPAIYQVDTKKKSMVVHHDRLKLFQCTEIPAWVKHKQNGLIDT